MCGDWTEIIYTVVILSCLPYSSAGRLLPEDRRESGAFVTEVGKPRVSERDVSPIVLDPKLFLQILKECFTVFHIIFWGEISETDDLEDECWVEAPSESQGGVVADVDHDVAFRFSKGVRTES